MLFNHNQIYILPLKIGTITQEEMGPRLINWPTENSKNITGMPIRKRNIINGMRKAAPPFS